MYTHFNLLDMSQYIPIYWLQTTQQHVSSAELRRYKSVLTDMEWQPGDIYPISPFWKHKLQARKY